MAREPPRAPGYNNSDSYNCIICTYTNLNTNARDQKKVLLKNSYPAVLHHEISVSFPRYMSYVVEYISLRGVLIFINDIYLLT